MPLPSRPGYCSFENLGSRVHSIAALGVVRGSRGTSASQLGETAVAKKSCPSISWGVRVLLAAAGTILSALANAAIIHVGFDPTFGGAFSDLSYKGSADLTTPSGCPVPSSGFGIVSTFSGACTGTTLDNLTVDLFVTLSPLTNDIVNASSLSHPPVNDFVVSATSTVIGLDTDWIDVGHAAALGASFTGGDLYLQFVANTNLRNDTTAPTVFIALGDCTISDNGTALSGDGCKQSPNSAGVTFTPTVTFPAPEPGSLYLVMLALGALPLCRWRRGRMI